MHMHTHKHHTLTGRHTQISYSLISTYQVYTFVLKGIFRKNTGLVLKTLYSQAMKSHVEKTRRNNTAVTN